MKLILDDGTEIPFENIKTLQINPGEKVVLCHHEPLAFHQYDMAQRMLREFLGPDVPFLILTDGMDLKKII